MKFPVLLLALAVLLLLFACQPQELQAKQTASKEPVTNVSAAPPAPQPTAPAPVVTQPTPTAPQPAVSPAPVNATLQACKALEQHLLDDLDNAQTEVNRKKRAYDNAVERYGSALDAPVRDNSTVQQRRDEQDAAEDTYKDAQTAYTDATKKLAKARLQCGLPSPT